jgi:hypothetical protein
MKATVTPTRRFTRTGFVAAVGAAASALITIGITAVLRDGESNANRPAVAVVAGHNLPATADAAEHWIGSAPPLAHLSALRTPPSTGWSRP